MSLFVKMDSLLSAEQRVNLHVGALENLCSSLRTETEKIAENWQCEYTDQFCETMDVFLREMEEAHDMLSKNLPSFLRTSAELYEQTEKDVAANAQQFKNVRTSMGRGTFGTAFTSAEQATTFTATWEEAEHADSSVHTASSGQTHGGSGRTSAGESSSTSAESSAAASESGGTLTESNGASEQSGCKLPDWIASVGAIAKGILERVIAEQTGTVTEGSGTEATIASGDSTVEQESITDAGSEVTAARVVTEEQRAAMDSVSDQRYIMGVDGACNMNAIANLVRRRQALDGKEATATWEKITDINANPENPYYISWSTVATGVGSTYGYAAETYAGSVSTDEIKNLLDNHPEGIMVFTGSHGIVITRYIEGEDGTLQFEVADSGTGYSVKNENCVTLLEHSYTSDTYGIRSAEDLVSNIIRIFYLNY